MNATPEKNDSTPASDLPADILHIDGPLDEAALMAQVRDRVDLASDQDTPTWIYDGGKRVAAIVPVDVLEDHARRLAELLHGKHPQ